MKLKSYYPVNLDLHGKTCLVVGGGDVAERKARTLLSFGAQVIIVSPEVNKKIAVLVKSRKVAYFDQKYKKALLKSVFLVIAATDDQAVNASVARDAAGRNILVNIVDEPALCNFIVPSVIRRGPLVMGISTGGQSPLFAKELRKKCEKCLTPRHGDLVRMLGEARKEVKCRYATPAKRKAVFKKIMASKVFKDMR